MLIFDKDLCQAQGLTDMDCFFGVTCARARV